jgi:hypothetical protein
LTEALAEECSSSHQYGDVWTSQPVDKAECRWVRVLIFICRHYIQTLFIPELSVILLGINWYTTWASYSKSAACRSHFNLRWQVVQMGQSRDRPSCNIFFAPFVIPPPTSPFDSSSSSINFTISRILPAQVDGYWCFVTRWRVRMPVRTAVVPHRGWGPLSLHIDITSCLDPHQRPRMLYIKNCGVRQISANGP